MRVIVSAIVLYLSVAHAALAHAQSPCDIADEFRLLAQHLGAETTGACVEPSRELAFSERFVLADGVALVVPAGGVVQVFERGVFRRFPLDESVAFFDRWGGHAHAAGAFADVPWSEMNRPAPAATSDAQPSPPPSLGLTQPVTSRQGADPVLISRCTDIARQPTAESGLPHIDAFPFFQSGCRNAIDSHGGAGASCYLAAWSEFAPIIRYTKPGSRAVFDAADGRYRQCVSSR